MSDVFLDHYLGVTEQMSDVFLVSSLDPVIPKEDKDNRLHLIDCIVSMKWPLSARWIMGCTAKKCNISEDSRSTDEGHAEHLLKLLQLTQQAHVSTSNRSFLANLYGITPPGVHLPGGDGGTRGYSNVCKEDHQALKSRGPLNPLGPAASLGVAMKQNEPSRLSTIATDDMMGANADSSSLLSTIATDDMMGANADSSSLLSTIATDDMMGANADSSSLLSTIATDDMMGANADSSSLLSTIATDDMMGANADSSSRLSTIATDDTMGAYADSSLLLTAGCVPDNVKTIMGLQHSQHSFCSSYAAMYIQQYLAEAAARNASVYDSNSIENLLCAVLKRITSMQDYGNAIGSTEANDSDIGVQNGALFMGSRIFLTMNRDLDVNDLTHAYMLVWAVAVLNLQPPSNWINFMWNLLQPDLLASRGSKEQGLKGETLEELKILAAWAFTALQQESSKRALIASLISMPPGDQSLTTLSAALWVYTQYCITHQHKPALLSTATDTAAVYNKITSKAEQQWLHGAAKKLSRAVQDMDVRLGDAQAVHDRPAGFVLPAGLVSHGLTSPAAGDPSLHHHLLVCASGLQCLVYMGYMCPEGDADEDIWCSSLESLVWRRFINRGLHITQPGSASAGMRYAAGHHDDDSNMRVDGGGGVLAGVQDAGGDK
ncbi:hypothetical protein CEUSTIGMA_g13347.t1 [Chlamydomonas eustigma]|uniref:Uncharacterized protein n=1 Tax=Chlamydomonas eustigma TaxID=1157962 RepID=A0A250XS67_9CHLO|nr:hypothetical protein CEUSTIGMA_g13347.t1 [Chlamydomonas eustigma]|eukprot:GAX85931.1 hypothetical protein CEUSTIGMA_g13347.t1 [Chlamydomonas eustigma]